ncbi:MAG: branched-chain amino acid ABC transporter permease [Desulfobacteraceae bacterium]|nr:branched-chain amino acid ABC transporter permease [Desulfobacteraceae bacterium]
MSWSLIPHLLVAGITNGSIYALIALGYCLIHNATGLVNFAQGEFVMLGAMIVVSLHNGLHIPLPVAFALAVGLVAATGILLERGPIRHSRNRDILTLVMITIGASIAFRGASMMVWGKSAHILPSLGGDSPLILFNAAILPQSLWILGFSILVLGMLYFFFHMTLVGKAMRAVSDNRLGATLIGISPGKLVALAFAMSGALGALAGILITPITSMSYDAGVMLGLKGFSAAILGGYGSVPGAVVGGVLLGVLESLGSGLISSAYKDAIAFLLLLAILFVRPAGLFGKLHVKRL